MRKSTKIISTAIALVLIVGFMIVGIYAATSAAANISANVSWTATAGLEFELYCDLWGTQNSYVDSGASSWEEYTENTDTRFDDNVMNVDTTTSNEKANGSATMNASFFDPTDDGVNNPQSLVYGYYIENNCSSVVLGYDENYYGCITGGTMVDIVVTLTKYPVSNDFVEVRYFSFVRSDEFGPFGAPDYPNLLSLYNGVGSLAPGTTYNLGFCVSGGEPYLESCAIFIVLTLKDPNQSLASFDAGVSFSLTKGNVVNYS